MGGGPSQATQEQQQVQLQSSQQQLQFNNQLMALFNKQYASQQNVLNYLQGQVKPIIARSEAGQGMSAAAEAAMRTSATDTIAGNEQAAQQALNQREAQQMGGSNIMPSGVNAQLDAALLDSAARQQSGAQLGITQYNQNLANSNLWNSLNVMSGNAAMMNPQSYAGEATSGSGAVASGSGAQSSLQNSITQANANSFGGSFMKSLGGAMGGFIGSGGGFDPQAQWG